MICEVRVSVNKKSKNVNAVGYRCVRSILFQVVEDQNLEWSEERTMVLFYEEEGETESLSLYRKVFV